MVFDERPEVRKVEKAYLGFLGCLVTFTGLWFLVFVAVGVLILLTAACIFLTVF